MYEFLSVCRNPYDHWNCGSLKRAGLPIKYSPLVSLALGLFFGIFYLETFRRRNYCRSYDWTLCNRLYSGSKNM